MTVTIKACSFQSLVILGFCFSFIWFPNVLVLRKFDICQMSPPITCHGLPPTLPLFGSMYHRKVFFFYFIAFLFFVIYTASASFLYKLRKSPHTKSPINSMRLQGNDTFQPGLSLLSGLPVANILKPLKKYSIS